MRRVNHSIRTLTFLILPTTPATQRILVCRDICRCDLILAHDEMQIVHHGATFGESWHPYVTAPLTITGRKSMPEHASGKRRGTVHIQYMSHGWSHVLDPATRDSVRGGCLAQL